MAAAVASNTDSDDSSESPARRTLKQKREQEAERFKTQTITPSNIIEEEAKAVVEAITVRYDFNSNKKALRLS